MLPCRPLMRMPCPAMRYMRGVHGHCEGDAEAAPATKGCSALASPVNLPALRRVAFTCASAAAVMSPAMRSTSASFRLATALRFAAAACCPCSRTHKIKVRSRQHAWPMQ